MYPAWAIELYASIRLTSVWASAARLPMVMVSSAISHRALLHSACRPGTR